MPSKARLLAKSMIESPILSEITSNPSVIPATITSAVDEASVGDFASPDLLPNTGNEIGDQAFVQSSNRLYIWNGTGWYNIALINTTPTWDSGGQPLSSYELDADSPQDATVITLAASDPDGLPISYSYVTSGSMDSMATISQDSSVFTVTPKTVSEVGEGVELTGSITFRASDGVNILPSVSSFTLNFVFFIENSKYTTLLATAIDTSDNSNITDSSTNNHTITVLGDANTGTFSPYRHGGYSTYFPDIGNTNNFTVNSNDVVNFGTGDFTIEAWVFFEASDSSLKIVEARPSSTNGYYVNFGAGPTFLSLYTNSNTFLSSSSVPGVGVWSHCALVRNNGTTTIYLNGQSGGSVSDTNNYISASVFGVGSYQVFAGESLRGKTYIKDLRVVKGTAVYTSNFTPPSEPLEAIANTSLLTCHLPYITDGSSNGHAITRNGSTSVKPFTPFDNLEYIVADHGGSIYFDGIDDGLTIPAAAWDRDADYTVECWAYTTGSLNVAMSRNRQAADGIVFSIGGSYTVFLGIGRDDVNTWDLTYTGTVDLRYQWHHLALTHDASEKRYKIYIDGVNVFNGTSAYHPGSLNSVFNIGCGDTMNAGTNSYSIGWIADHRITDSIVYTANFTPPLASLSSTGTVLHLKGTDASIIDKSQTNNLKLFGNTTGSTTQVKFANTKSMYFDGTGDYIKTLASTDYDFPADFTIESWIYPTALTGNHLIVDTYSASQAGSYQLYWRSIGGSLTFYTQADGVVIQDPSGSNIQVNTWHHVAVARSGNTIRMFVDGTQVNSTTLTRNLTHGIPVAIGYQQATGTNYFAGYMQDIRITKGLARYTANFTPPTESFKG